MKRKNILLLLSDQQRLDTVSAYGLNDIVRTPHIDGLAARGVRFDNAFTPTAICAPARASVHTGLYPHRHGVTGNGMSIREGVQGLPDYLNPAGYRCGYAGKWHADDAVGPSEVGYVGKDFIGYAFPGSGLLPGLQFGAKPKTGNPYADYLQEKGFETPTVTDRYVGTNPGCQDQEMFALHNGPVESSIEYFVGEETIRVIDELTGPDAESDDEQPFFIWANFWGPHTPCLVPEPYFSMYNPDDIPEHPSYRETWEGKPYRQQLIERMWGLGDLGWRGFQEISARYFGHCTLIDDQVGRIVAHLAARGLLEDTVIIYSADHGDCLGAHKLIEKGEFMYDEIYRIPLVVAHPDCAAPGSVNDDFVCLHEVTPSFLEIAGVEGAEMDGQSFLPAMLGDHTPNGREEVYCVFHRHFTVAEQRMVRTRTHQFTFNSGDAGELYDLVADPYQLHNVYGQPEYESVRQDLMARMKRYMDELDDPLRGWFGRVGPVY
ncbi:MAG: sulfatase-like hydrolase/transferase [Caldilineaceae bacterium]|nr:sulfatase-like hydrolase/transferase [Caldilineaceae bacterium]